MGFQGFNIETLTDLIGLVWLFIIILSMLIRLSNRMNTNEERYLARCRVIDFEIEMQEYYWKCVREGLTEAQDQIDEQIKDLSEKQLEEMICNIIEEKGMKHKADIRWQSYNRGAKVTRKIGIDFDQVINN